MNAPWVPHTDGLGRPFDPAVASREDWDGYLLSFDSYARTAAMWFAMMRAPTAELTLQVFLDWGNMCDAPWPWRAASTSPIS